MTLNLLAFVLAVWRLTAILVYDKWTVPLRVWAGVFIVDEYDQPLTLGGKVLGCFWCTSLFVSVVLGGCAAANFWLPIWLLAGSGGAVILNHWTRIVRDAES